jgi:midasin
MRPIHGREELDKNIIVTIRNLFDLLENKNIEELNCLNRNDCNSFNSDNDIIGHINEYYNLLSVFSSENFSDSKIKELILLINKMLIRRSSLFEWVDGPRFYFYYFFDLKIVTKSMKNGNLFLIDEISLAEDAVIERINSVLEINKCLYLTEKGNNSNQNRIDLNDNKDYHHEDKFFTFENDVEVIKAHQNFRLFATMNPGGDFGKRELSPGFIFTLLYSLLC